MSMQVYIYAGRKRKSGIAIFSDLTFVRFSYFSFPVKEEFFSLILSKPGDVITDDKSYRKCVSTLSWPFMVFKKIDPIA